VRSCTAGFFIVMTRALAALFALLFAAADSPQSIVKYRQASMKSMGGHMNAMSLVVKHQISSRADLEAHATAVHDVSRRLVEWFPAGSGPDQIRTEARPAIWQQLPEFKRVAAKLERESAKLAALAKQGDAKAFDEQFKVVSDTCSDCHDSFRVHD